MTSSFAYSKDETLLTVDQLCVSYGTPILKNVSFTVRDIRRPGLTQGQKVALLAPSGMGKTQLFKRIAGLEAPTSGRVLIGPSQLPVKAGMVGVVPQNYLLFEHRTVGQTLMIAANMHDDGLLMQTVRAKEMAEQFGLTDKWKCYPAELSGGQRQRVSIAEQLLSSNHFLLMDEPFSGLDIITKRKVCDVINTVASKDELNTIIFSTHDIESAVMIADTILILGRNRLGDGTPEPGACIQDTIDLIERDLAWQPDIERLPAFAQTVNEIKAIFPRL